MNTSKADTQKELITFFVSTYGVSWILFFIGHQLDFLLIILLGIWGPSLVSIVLTGYFRGKEGDFDLFKRFKRIRVKWYWWVALFLLPASIHFTGKSLWQLFYIGDISPSILNISYWLGAIIPSIIIAGLGEELGWRGFALPRLQLKYSPITASFILAIIHLLWHLPTYWLGQGMHNVPFIYVVAFMFPWTFLFNWLYNKSGGSLVFAVGFHAISNASLSIVSFMPWENEFPLSPKLLTDWSFPIELGGPYLSVCAVYLVVALIIVFKGKFYQVNTDTP